MEPVVNNDASCQQGLFDEYGRCIPSGISSAAHRNTRRYFICTQPDIDYSAIHGRISRHLGANNTLSATEFETRAKSILQRLREDTRASNIVNGVGVPFLLPQASYPDLGQTFEDTYLTAVEQSFSEVFPEYSFINHHKDGLAGRLGIVPGSRHQQLLDAMHQSSVVGYYFPALSEYSLPAAVERLQALPEHFFLAGGFDTAAALIGSPDLLLRTDGYPPLLWLAALAGDKDAVGYHFEAYGYNLTFNRRPHFNQAAEYWTSGLIVLG